MPFFRSVPCDDVGCGCTLMQETLTEYVRFQTGRDLPELGRFCALTTKKATVGTRYFLKSPGNTACFRFLKWKNMKHPGALIKNITKARQILQEATSNGS